MLNGSLRDIQSIHSHMVAKLDRAGGRLEQRPSSSARSRDRRGGDRDALDVPEFIPPA